MVKVREELDLSNDSLSVDEVLEGVGHLLDGDLLVGFLVQRRAYYAIGASSNAFDVLVLLMYNELSIATLPSAVQNLAALGSLVLSPAPALALRFVVLARLGFMVFHI